MENKIRILLAEDDVNLGKVLTEYLTAKGYNVVHANNGEVAYEMFCSHDFDICLIDVMMPLKDGFTLAKEIRKLDKHIPIIFLTAK
ncbi:MAG: response regulator, partial [Bacteroidales bacterium]|nr:response regulator [Bacteroidales bacterium]